MAQHRRWIESSGKRFMDVAAGTIGLVVVLPVLVVTAIVVWVDVGRPVILRQTRAGRAGVPIEILKFRTMTDARDEQGRMLSDELRLTEVGRRLRSWSVDEVPQLLAVLKGDMSLVGPRPLPVPYVARYGDRQRVRLAARPGLTGWSQVNGRNSLAWPDKLELDVWYVENASLRLDLRIVMMTARSLASRSGVSAVGHATMPEFTGEH